MLQPEGELSNVDVSFNSGNEDAKQWLLAADFERLGWQQWRDIPGLSGLTGRLYVQDRQGHLELNSEHTTLTAKSN